MDLLAPHSVHLVVTSAPYWTLKEYRDSDHLDRRLRVAIRRFWRTRAKQSSRQGVRTEIEILLTKLVRERLYDAACLLTTNAGARGRRVQGAFQQAGV